MRRLEDRVFGHRGALLAFVSGRALRGVCPGVVLDAERAEEILVASADLLYELLQLTSDLRGIGFGRSPTGGVLREPPVLQLSTHS